MSGKAQQQSRLKELISRGREQEDARHAEVAGEGERRLSEAVTESVSLRTCVDDHHDRITHGVRSVERQALALEQRQH